MADNCCYGCEDRKVGCHATCEKYIDWQKQHIEQIQNYKDKKRLMNDSRSFQIEGIRRIKKKNGKY